MIVAISGDDIAVSIDTGPGYDGPDQAARRASEAHSDHEQVE